MRNRGHAEIGVAGPGNTVHTSPSLFGPGGRLWSHLLSQAHFKYSGLKSGSAQEKSKVQLNTRLCLVTPTKLPPGHTSEQDRIPTEPPWTSQSLPPVKETPSLQPQEEADSDPSTRTGPFCFSDLTKAPCGHSRSQVRRAGQSANTAPSRRLHWVREGADRVLGVYGRGRGQNPPSANRANLGCGRAVWSSREEQVRQWAAEMLVALEALHEQGVLCRDLNPQNLLLDQAGRSPSTPVPSPLLGWEPRGYKATCCLSPLPFVIWPLLRTRVWGCTLCRPLGRLHLG